MSVGAVERRQGRVENFSANLEMEWGFLRKVVSVTLLGCTSMYLMTEFSLTQYWSMHTGRSLLRCVWRGTALCLLFFQTQPFWVSLSWCRCDSSLFPRRKSIFPVYVNAKWLNRFLWAFPLEFIFQLGQSYPQRNIFHNSLSSWRQGILQSRASTAKEVS